MPTFLDYDPVTGIRHDFDYDEMTGEAKIHYTQDVEPLLDYTRALASEGATDKGIKKGFWLYAKIPALVQVQMHQKGIDLADPDSTKAILAEINSNYPHLKCTQKNEGGRTKLIYDLGRKDEGLPEGH